MSSNNVRYSSLNGTPNGSPSRIITNEPRAENSKSIRYAKQYNTQELGDYQKFLEKVGEFTGLIGLLPLCCCLNPWAEVRQGNVGLITKFGEISRVVDPGPSYVNTFSERLTTVNIMTRVMPIPEQSCLTKDNVIAHLKSVLYYEVVDPLKATYAVANLEGALCERTQTTLRDVVGARSLQDVIERREEIAEAIQEIINEVASQWGVLIEAILIKDFTLDQDITQALSQAAQAKRIGESKIITAKAEVESAKLMRQAADILASKAAMQIRYLDAMQVMAKQSGSKVIFMPGSSGDIDITDTKASSSTPPLFPEDAVAQQTALQESLQ